MSGGDVGDLVGELRAFMSPFFARGDEGEEGILWIILSCKSTKDSCGDSAPCSGCFPCARTEREERAEDLDFCHADLTVEFAGRAANLSVSEVIRACEDGGAGGAEVTIMS